MNYLLLFYIFLTADLREREVGVSISLQCYLCEHLRCSSKSQIFTGNDELFCKLREPKSAKRWIFADFFFHEPQMVLTFCVCLRMFTIPVYWHKNFFVGFIIFVFLSLSTNQSNNMFYNFLRLGKLCSSLLILLNH